MRFVLRLLINAAAIWVALRLVDGLTFEGGWLRLLAVALVFGVVNAVIRPIVKLLTCPLLILTLGLFTLVINALMLMLTAWLSEIFALGFSVNGFWPAFWAALIISIVSAILSIVLPDDDEKRD
ncbi:MAG TPA: phage holin family protein [Thermoanaerobaculia bacterium]|nr:phage holin family protein [Thermoanaerobaculia bacterium]